LRGIDIVEKPDLPQEPLSPDTSSPNAPHPKASLLIETDDRGLGFYLNGDLQFHSQDEAIYHEHLVLPAIALAQQRQPDRPLRVLICGGGDGLATRDCLRVAAVEQVELVDYDEAVINLARSQFVPFNGDSLHPDHDRVTVTVEDALTFVARQSDDRYDVVILDFTCPTHPDHEAVYSYEFYQQIRRLLRPLGVVALNAVSPIQTPTAFGCIDQTLAAAGLEPHPMLIDIPSFQVHGYDRWGFFLASPEPIRRAELQQLVFPPDLRSLNSQNWLQCFQFPAAIVAQWSGVMVHTQAYPHLFYYLLNGVSQRGEVAKEWAGEDWIDVLDLKRTDEPQFPTQLPLDLSQLTQRWLAIGDRHQNGPGDPPIAPHLQQLIPNWHAHQTPAMTQEWLEHLGPLLKTLDPQRLITALGDRAASLPPAIAAELETLGQSLRQGVTSAQLATGTAQMITAVSVTMLAANLTAPDPAFAKGFSGGGYSSGGNSSGGYSSSYSESYSGDYSGSSGTRMLGMILFATGFFWLLGIAAEEND
jgi:spermidine synthase